MDYQKKQKQIKSQLEHNKELIQRAQKALNQLIEEQIKILGKIELIDEIIGEKDNKTTIQKKAA